MLPDQVALEELELAANLLVLRRPYDGIWVYGASLESPEYVPGTASPEGTGREYLRVSPDGRWLAFTASDSQTLRRTLWISSVDGSHEQEVMEVDTTSRAAWTSDGHILVDLYPEEWAPPFHLALIDPTTLEIRELIREPQGMAFLNYVPLDGDPYAIYFYDEWELYDYGTAASRIVLHWLREDLGPTLNLFRFYNQIHMSLYSSGSGLVADVLLTRDCGFDYVQGVPLDYEGDALSDGRYTLQVDLPEDDGETMIVEAAPSGRYIVKRSFLVSEAPPGYASYHFYLLDIPNTVAYDYPIGLSESFWPGPSLSPDGRFLAWSKDENGSGPPPWTTFVLELASGRMATVEGEWEFVGWSQSE